MCIFGGNSKGILGIGHGNWCAFEGIGKPTVQAPADSFYDNPDSGQSDQLDDDCPF